MTNLQKAFNLFDEYNKHDPHELTWNGEVFATEYFYALQLHRWVLKLEPNASEAVLLASRAQHIGRWMVARASYPEGKAGYLNWRSDLSKFHAEKAAGLMLQAGYEPEMIAQVQKIILKQKIKLDPEVQLIENALCLVFLEFQFEEFRLKHDEEKLLTIVKKTWNKMSQAGRDAAMTLVFSDAAKALIVKAIS